MTTLNSFATLAEYKAYAVGRGQTASIGTADDGVIERLLRAASHHIESGTARHFVPYIETRYFDVPYGQIDNRALQVDDDLLEVISLTNGDGTAIASTEYTLRQNNTRNRTPYNTIRLIDNSTSIWASDGAGDVHDVIAVNGVWGYHDRYTQAWLLATTANEALDASETGYDVTDGSVFAVGNLIRFDNELGYVSSISSNTLTLLKRGENYSTAASHLTAINVYIWQPMEEAREAVCEITRTAYGRRMGESNSNTATITAAGVVLSPRDIPDMAKNFIQTYRQLT